jgi:NAD(P)-dependent dehydrogenase (short-subunit alcohol dehydrogenase family)
MSFLQFVRAQHKALPISLTPSDCQGHTYIVTGANSGLGYECVKHLARLGSTRVILAVRNIQKGEAAKKSIEADTGCSTNILEVWEVDLGSYESVAAFAKRAGEELDRIDGIVENAGIAEGVWVEREGNETSMTVNIFSTFLMALLMLPHLQSSAKKFSFVPRLVIIGSGVAFQAKPAWKKLDIDNIFGDLRDRKKWEPKFNNTQ